VIRTDRTARRLAVGLITNLFGQGMVALSLIIMTPIIVHAVGASDYGVWVLFGSVASFGFLLELGIAAALVKYVAEHAARDEVQAAAAMVGAATWLYALLGLALTVIGAVAALVVPTVVQLHGAFARLFAPLSILVALNLGIAMLAVAPITVLRALQRYTAANTLTGAGAALSAVLSGLALVIGSGIVGVAAAVALSSTVTYVASLSVSRRLAPGYMHDLFRPDRRLARQLFRFSRSVAVTQVAIQLQTRLDAVVIAAALPIRFLAPYNFAQQLSTGIGLVTDQFGNLLLPLAAQMNAAPDRRRLRELYLISTRVTLAIALAVGLPTAILGGSILGLWVGNRYRAYGDVVALLAAASVVDLTAYSAASLLQSIERHGPIARMALASGVMNVVLSIVLVSPLGVKGVALATLITTTAEITLLVVPYAGRVLEVSSGEFARHVLLRLLPAAAACAAVLVGGAAILPMTSLAALLLVAVAAFIVYAVVYLASGASGAERDAYRRLAVAVRAGAARSGADASPAEHR
jgi:O-antigen/teichoic acid export membrane protein